MNRPDLEPGLSFAFAGVLVLALIAGLLAFCSPKPTAPTPTAPTATAAPYSRAEARTSRGLLRPTTTAAARSGGGGAAHTPEPPRRSPSRRVERPGVWALLAACESSGRLHADSRDGGQHVHGLYQLDAGWYRQFGIDPWASTAGQQLRIARYVLARQGWGAWPWCARKVGVL